MSVHYAKVAPSSRAELRKMAYPATAPSSHAGVCALATAIPVRGVQIHVGMSDLPDKIQVLVVQFWIHDRRPIRAALQRAGLDLTITRVDIEPALYAALTCGRYDLVIYDPATTTISKATVEETLRASRRDVPLLVADDLETLGARAYELLRSRAC